MARIALALLALTLCAGGCSNEPLLRDFYWGKSVLQPQATPGPTPRDRDGNAIIEDDRSVKEPDVDAQSQ